VIPHVRLLVAALFASTIGAVAPAAIGREIQKLTGAVTTYTVIEGDSLARLGARFGVDAATIAADNEMAPTARLAAGQPMRIDNRHIIPSAARAGITINVPQRMLFYATDGAVVGLPVAVGQASWRTPILPFTTVRKETDPTWDVPASIREEARRAGRHLPLSVPPGPANPLGKHWLGLSIPGVGIHGTNAPASIYRVTTHGCIRVGPDDIAWLFPRVSVGTPGQIIYEPILLAATEEGVFLEVHVDVYRRLTVRPREVVRVLAGAAGVVEDVDWTLVDAVLGASHGIARSIGLPRP
jgi:L,D-transpeptidase ErfK/SrfK